MKKYQTRMIVISGAAQNGKDTAARYIEENLEAVGKRVKICHYADLLKYICKEFFDWDCEKNEDGRSLLQYVGTDVVRKMCPDFWVMFIVQVITFFDGQWDWFIVPDCRFPNELEIPRTVGIDTFHLEIIRDDFDNGLSREQRDHISENALAPIDPDYTIYNDGSLDDLRSKINIFIGDYLDGIL